MVGITILTGFFSIVLIILALFSTVSKTTLIIFVFGTQILREVRYKNEPKLFRVLVLSYRVAGTLWRGFDNTCRRGRLAHLVTLSPEKLKTALAVMMLGIVSDIWCIRGAEGTELFSGSERILRT